MNNGRYVDKDTIIKRVHQYYGITIWGEDVNDFIYDGLRGIATYKHYILTTTDGDGDNADPIEVTNYKGTLPVDIEYPIHAYDQESLEPMLCIDNIYKNNYANYLLDTSTTLESADGYTQNAAGLYLNYPDSTAELQKTYQLKKHHIFTNTKEQNVVLIYLAFPKDDAGNPLIPDEEDTLKAITAYVAMSVARVMYMKDQLAKHKFDEISQDYYAYAYSTTIETPNEDEMEAIKNDLLTLLPNYDAHNDNYRYLGFRKQIQRR